MMAYEHSLLEKVIDGKKYRIAAHETGWWYARVQRKRWWGEWESIPGTAGLGVSYIDAILEAVSRFESLTGKKWPVGE